LYISGSGDLAAQDANRQLGDRTGNDVDGFANIAAALLHRADPPLGIEAD
jgi:hypothetical protein